ncbi:MAG: NAD(P)-dependent oxidoreductase [Pelagimonas sp.]|jgi:nucleoside-diphosphate-sugar epimerase|nr:NAD(P)-dependent oxidoreductase [Pelagimonas sp.]
MGAVKMLITGANGFVGRACVARARALGHEVVALYRSTPRAEWRDDPGIQARQADLAQADSTVQLRELATDCQAVIHAAAHLGSDPDQLANDTSQATAHLLQALQETRPRLVLVSSIAVYATDGLTAGDTLTEATPLETAETARDPYTASKLHQEAQCQASGLPLWLMRPGAIYGPGRTWHALMGFWASKLHVTLTSQGELPVTHVDHVARALISAALTDPQGVRALNVLDDQRPTRTEFLTAHRKITGWPRLNLSIPYGVWLSLVRLVKPIAGKLPGLFQEPIFKARMMPLRYPNTALRDTLGGADTAPFDQMLAQSYEAET